MRNVPGIYTLIYEDEWLFVVSKAALVHSTGESKGGEPSLSEALACPESGLEEEASLLPDSGLLQRLDFSSSGLLLGAKTEIIREELRNELMEGSIAKRYLCLVQGIFEGGKEIEGYIGSPYRRAKKMKYYPKEPRASERALPSKSLFTFAAPGLIPDSSFLFAEASPARRHQVRLHSATLGFPLLGDTLYGGPPLESLPELLAMPLFQNRKRQFFLHASSLSFLHPRSHENLLFSCIPDELSDLHFSSNQQE